MARLRLEIGNALRCCCCDVGVCGCVGIRSLSVASMVDVERKLSGRVCMKKCNLECVLVECSECNHVNLSRESCATTQTAQGPRTGI